MEYLAPLVLKLHLFFGISVLSDISYLRYEVERYLAKVARKSAKHHLKGPAKRTAEDDQRFEESLRRLIESCST